MRVKTRVMVVKRINQRGAMESPVEFPDSTAKMNDGILEIMQLQKNGSVKHNFPIAVIERWSEEIIEVVED